jgi:hypothetical protein
MQKKVHNKTVYPTERKRLCSFFLIVLAAQKYEVAYCTKSHYPLPVPRLDSFRGVIEFQNDEPCSKYRYSSFTCPFYSRLGFFEGKYYYYI